MDLELTDDQKMLQQTVREFASTEVQPRAHEIDETGEFPRETFRKAAEIGLTGIALPITAGNPARGASGSRPSGDALHNTPIARRPTSPCAVSPPLTMADNVGVPTR